MKRTPIGAALAAGMFCSWAPADTQVIALSGIAKPFSTFDVPPVISIGGAAFSGADSSGNTGVWYWNNNALALVADSTTPAPGTSGTFASFVPPAINSSGKVAFWGQTGSTEGIWSYSGSLALVALQGDTVPGETYTFSSFQSPRLSNLGQVAYRATATGGTNYFEGLWAFGKAIAVEGKSAGATGGNFNSDIDDSPALANNLVAFRASWDGSNAGAGVWRAGTSGGPTLIAKAGDASGLGGATIKAPLGPVLATNSGHVIFKADLEGGTATAAIFRHASSLQTVVSTLDAEPQTSGSAWIYLDKLAANQLGKVAFTGSFDPDTGNNSDSPLGGVWKEAAGGLARVAVEGAGATDATGQVISGVTFGGIFPKLAINDNGMVAFIGQMTGTGINAGNDDGLWAEDPSGKLRLIVREGDAITVGSGDTRTVTSINFAGVAGDQFDGHAVPLAFDGNNRLLYHVTFVGGTEAVLVTVVPEPAHLALVALSALLLRRQRRASGR